MSGPGLAQHDAHHAIHEAAFAEAEELTRLLHSAAIRGDREQALDLANLLMEHWRTRTLRHATAEEQGWYRDITDTQPEREHDIIQLTRDHDLLRILIGEIQQILTTHGWSAGVIERFEAMLLLSAIHSREEEQHLLGGESLQAEPAIWDADPTASPANAAKDATSVTAEQRPLEIASPALYRQALEVLASRGLHPGDVQLTAQSLVPGQTDEGPVGSSIRVRAAYGPSFSESMEVVLTDPQNHAQVQQVFERVARACEQAVRAGYFAAMQITEPGAPGHAAQAGHIPLTVFPQSKDNSE